MKRMVDWDDEENGEREPFEEVSATDVSDDEQSNDEEPRINDVLENLSNSFLESALPTCCTVWLLPKIFCFGPRVGNYFEKPASSL